MSVKGMMQTVLVTELKQIQQDISNEALHYVVDNFSQVFDVREILAEENQELYQSNKNLNMALQKVSDYNSRLERQLSDERMKNLRLETDRDAWVATIGHMSYLIERVYDSYKNNTGHEPSVSVFHRALDEAQEFINKTPRQCLAEIKAEAVLQFAGTVLVKYRYDITEWAKEYADKVRQGEL